tara:strand:+ start:288 stop:1304 length:1017 start_codon:yes stop_codon:yes gene_type:complete
MKITPSWSFSNLTFSQIEAGDTLFDWFPGVLSVSLQNSLEQNGIQFPLLVQAIQHSKYRLVDGFKRFSWLTTDTGVFAQEKQETLLPCFILPESLPEQETSLIRLETLPTSSENFSGVYVSRVIKMLQESGYSKEEIAVQVLPRLGQKPSERLARQLLDLHEMLLRVELPESMLLLGCEDVLPLLKFSQSVLPDVVALFGRLEVSGKKWRNLLQLLDEVSRLRKISVSDVLYLPEILKILGRSSLQSPIRYRLLKQQLEIWRFPELSDLQRKFNQGRKSLKLAPRITLESDPYFENDDLTLTLKIRSVEELRGHLESLRNPENSEKVEVLWKDLFALL